MICFLTSMPILNDDGSYADVNGFVTRMREAVSSPCRMLFICSDPDTHERTDFYAQGIMTSCARSGIYFTGMDVLDGRNKDDAAALIRGEGFIVLAGGHVPTQNRFFADIGLKGLLAGFDGVLMGISAGSMNSASVVYAHPELEGEAIDPSYEKFLPGLGLTDIMMLPHYQAIKDDVLDGLRVFEDIAYPDSMGRRFHAFPDGSYIYIKDGEEHIFGETYIIEDGALR